MNQRTGIHVVFALLCGLVAVPTAAQEGEVGGPPTNPPVVAEHELTLRHYVPQTSSANQLTELAFNMWGRVFVTSPGSKNTRRNIFQNVDSVVVYDERARADRIMQMLQELDGAQQRRAEESIEATVIKLEHATIAEAQAVLRPFMRHINRRLAGGAPRQVVNMEFVQTRSVVVVRDDEKTVAEMKRVLAQIDVPRPQVLLTCWVIRSSDKGAADKLTLPAELTDNLKKLVPVPGFQGIGVGMVNTSVEPNEQIGMNVSLGEYGTAQLTLHARAFDRGSNVMHLRQCRCQLSLRDPLKKGGGGWGNAQSQSLTTQLALQAGEYTVLGAVGSEPVFVVLRMTKRNGKTN